MTDTPSPDAVATVARPDVEAIQQSQNHVAGLVSRYVLICDAGADSVTTTKMALKIALEAPTLLEHIDALLAYLAQCEAEITRLREGRCD